MTHYRYANALVGMTCLLVLCGFMWVSPAIAANKLAVLDDTVCAIAPDGSVQCWGSAAEYDQVPGRATFVNGFPAELSGLMGYTYGLCGLTASGGLLCSGSYPGDGNSFADLPVAPTGMTAGVIAADRNYSHVCAVKTDGSVWCWGYAWYGLGDTAITQESLSPIEVLPASFQAAGVSLSTNHACVWSQGGEVRCWGANYWGQVGAGAGTTGSIINIPTTVFGVANVVQVDASAYDHTCAVTAGGSVYCWGQNDYSQLGDNTYANTESPVLASNFSSINVSSVATGHQTTCVQSQSGWITCNGANYVGQIGASGSLQADNGQVAMGEDFACALIDGMAYCWGNNSLGQLGIGQPGSEYWPQALAESDFISAPHAGWQDGCGVRAGGDARCWGYGYSGSGEPGPFDPLQHYSVLGLGGDAAFMAPGSFHHCAMRTDHAVLCWGGNWWGQVGNGSTAFQSSPSMNISPSAGAIQLAVGDDHNCVLFQDQSVACWGRNDAGQLGTGDFVDRSYLSFVPGLTGVVHIATGVNSTCAVKNNGEIWCWGNNNDGELGDGSNTNSAVPVQVQGLSTSAVQVSVGNYHACGVLVDGSVACWGYGYNGALGNNQWGSSNVAVAVDSAEQFVQVTTGRNHTCARTTGNAIRCWGDGTYGQLGVGMIASYPVPVALSLLATDIHAGDNTTCARGVDGKSYCWGANEDAQLGIGRRGISAVPVAVVGFGDRIFTSGFEPD